MATDLTKLIKTKAASGAGASDRLNILFATSEVAPFSKTGGLGDVAASLPKALAGRGHTVSIITPLYGHLDADRLSLSKRLRTLSVPRRAKSQSVQEAHVWEGRFAQGVRIFFIESEPHFGRPGVYGYDGDTYDDNADRFAFFSRAVVEFVRQFSVPVDVLHCNDWHTALAPVFLGQYYRKELPELASLLTIHNAAYQGVFDKSAIDLTGLPKASYLKEDQLGHEGGTISYLKGGVRAADAITTVSPTYAEEIRSAKGGFGLHALYKERKENLSGILNGVDYSVWSPERDQHLHVRYDAENLNGKRKNKAELQFRFGLPVRPMLPLFAFVGRLTEQKGLDVLVPALRGLLKTYDSERQGFQCIFLGEGDQKYANAINRLAADFPSRVATHVGYDDVLAHQILAGSDLLLVPSRYEPCGLTQLYAMRYGTVPVVHSTGGLADTVADAAGDNGTGFVFAKNTKAEIASAIGRALETYSHHRQWRPMMVNAMHADFSWARSAEDYEKVYLDVRNARTEAN